MDHDWQKYQVCMEELKKRFAILDDALHSFRREGVIAVPNAELACLQLRKIYELIAFASLATNRERYAQIRRQYQKDWNLAEVLRLVENINPNSFPVAYRNQNGEIIDIPNLSFDRHTLARLHGDFGEILHAKNPYNDATDYRAWLAKCAEQRDRALQILNFHRVWPDPNKDQTFYLVQMHTLPDGAVQVSVFEKVSV